MLSWDMEAKVGGAETASLRSPAPVLPWSPFPRLTEGPDTEGFALLWPTALSVKWEKEPFLLQNHGKGATLCHVFACSNAPLPFSHLIPPPPGGPSLGVQYHCVNLQTCYTM